MGHTHAGQYQQWLHSQEIDRRLRAELETLEAELAQIQEQIQQSEHVAKQVAPQADNAIIRALVGALNGQTPSLHGQREQVSPPTIESPGRPDEPLATLSSELSNWGGLPNFEPEDTAAPTIHDRSFTTLAPADVALLPEDETMATFFDEYGQTQPQIDLPWWLRNIALAGSVDGTNRTGPLDSETLRTNRLVQRWLERWGRKPSPLHQPPEETPHG